MGPSNELSPEQLRRMLEDCVRRELAPGVPLPAADEDLVDCGAVDSMAWVGVVREVTRATGCADFDDRMMDRPRTIAAMLEAVLSGHGAAPRPSAAATTESAPRAPRGVAAIAGWGTALGSKLVEIAAVEKEFGLPARKLGRGAGLESVTRAAKGEDEAHLGAAAAEGALRAAGAGIADVDWIIATSETAVGFPSLGARLHAQLLAEESASALDVGGGCMGLLNALVTAHSLLAAGMARCVLVVTADVHSRELRPGAVKGEFGGLFGDGASAFVLRPAETAAANGFYRLGEWVGGGSGIHANAIRVHLLEKGKLELAFQGDALSRAALGKLEQIITGLELRSGLARATAGAFATHQPNPRLVEMLAKQLGVPAEKFPVVARTCGNLGSSTCGVALSRALTACATAAPQPSAPGEAGSPRSRAPIFVAALGPGLVWGGLVLR